MANYTKATNFTVKDTLTSGDPNKIVKGTEIDTEFIAISSAISSKADLASPAFTGVPTAPTAVSTTNTAQIASTAFVQSAIAAQNLGNMALQNKNAVDITGGTIAGATITGGTISGLATDLAVADGGTGASSFSANHLIVGNGTSPFQTIAPGTSGFALKSTGSAWTAQRLGLGMSGETWQSVSRSLGVTYTNSLSYPIVISVRGGASGTSGIIVNVNGTAIYFHQAQWNGPGAYPSATMIIPPGATYSVTMSSSGLAGWWELR